MNVLRLTQFPDLATKAEGTVEAPTCFSLLADREVNWKAQSEKAETACCFSRPESRVQSFGRTNLRLV
jgi:hypothetical protein